MDFFKRKAGHYEFIEKIEAEVIRIKFNNNKYSSQYINIELDNHNKCIKIHGGEGLIIRPEVSNVINIRLEKH